MTTKNYEFIEHTADICIRVKARDLKSLFQNAAAAMFDIIAERRERKAKSDKIFKVQAKGEDLEVLFINWLNELLSLSSARELIFSNFQIDKLDEHSLLARVRGNSVTNYRRNIEIKAATYHDLKIKKSASGWQAEVIFDV